MKAIMKFLNTLTTATDTLSMIFLCICTLTAFVNTVMRYIFLSPLRWSEELCVISLVFMVYFSLPRLEHQNEHLSMTALYNIFPPVLKKIVNTLRSLVTIGIVSWLGKAGIDVVRRNFVSETYTQVLDLPYGLIYAVIPLAFLVILIVRLLNITAKNPGEVLRDNSNNKMEGGAAQ
jgi:TRAP-type C4-dicarboxylate transport system permease small subunit